MCVCVFLAFHTFISPQFTQIAFLFDYLNEQKATTAAAMAGTSDSNYNSNEWMKTKSCTRATVFNVNVYGEIESKLFIVYKHTYTHMHRYMHHSTGDSILGCAIVEYESWKWKMLRCYGLTDENSKLCYKKKTR